MLDALMALPGFDFAAMADAMTSTANAEFVLWRRGRVADDRLHPLGSVIGD